MPMIKYLRTSDFLPTTFINFHSLNVENRQILGKTFLEWIFPQQTVRGLFLRTFISGYQIWSERVFQRTGGGTNVHLGI
jgi:hypothetical protein